MVFIKKNICLKLIIFFLLYGISKATLCEFCGKDFKSVGRHVWRCKSRTSLRINTPIINQPSERFSTYSVTITFNIESPNVSITNINNSIPPTNESPDDRTFNDLNDNDDDIAISDDVNDHNPIDIF